MSSMYSCGHFLPPLTQYLSNICLQIFFLFLLLPKSFVTHTNIDYLIYSFYIKRLFKQYFSYFYLKKRKEEKYNIIFRLEQELFHIMMFLRSFMLLFSVLRMFGRFPAAAASWHKRPYEFTFFFS